MAVLTPTFYSVFHEISSGYDEAGRLAHALGYWKDTHPLQARLLIAYIVNAFAELGCDLQRLQPTEPVPQVQALKKHSRLISRFYNALEDGGIITTNGMNYIRTESPIEETAPESLYLELLTLYPQHAVVTKLIRIIGSQLSSCLLGKTDPLNILFGDRENKKLLNDMYEFWPLLRAPTLLLGSFLEKALSSITHNRKIRILEVGAGTGGTTRHIVDSLQKRGIHFEYVFTDISNSLVVAAKRQLKNIPGMSFACLNIEDPVKPEDKSAFDVIVSTNCIHATKNLDTTLRHLRSMLRTGGVLTLVETTTTTMFWLDLVVGFFEGWWLFEDGRSYALVGVEEWRRHMELAGFHQVLWTEGSAPESKSIRVIAGFTNES